METELSDGKWTLDTTASSIGFQAKAAFGMKVNGLRVRDITQSVTFEASRSTTAGPPRYKATVVVSPKEYGITRWGTTKPVKVILDTTLKRA